MIFLMACTQADTTTREHGEISLLTYNIHGLPPQITGDDTTVRIRDIAPMLDSFDIVALQEDWMDDNHQILRESNDHLVVDRFDTPLDDDKVYGSGLSYFGAYPITSVSHVYYHSCHGFVSSGSDCFASKGVQQLTLQIEEDVSLHLLNTHLEAGGASEDDDARTEQIFHILDLLAEIPSEPVVVMGDFNLRPSDPVEDELLHLFREEGGLRQTCMEASCPEPDHIDQIFVRSGTEIQLNVQSWVRDESFVDSQGVDLSDHPAIVSHLTWER